MGRSSKILTAKEAKELDSKARELFGISTLILMENAGRAVFEELIRLKPRRNSAAIFCGQGNNGGDGFVAARHLLTRGIRPDVFLVGEISAVKNEARVNLEILMKLGQRIAEVQEENLLAVKDKIKKYSLIIDALLGVGLKGEVRGIYADLIGIINSSSAYKLAVDIPSGLDATTGAVLGCCVRADKTVTFMHKKRGMTKAKGPKLCGEIVVGDLGIPY